VVYARPVALKFYRHAFMKRLFLFISALGLLASCTDGDLYRRTVPARTTSTSSSKAPPAYGSPYYVTSQLPYGPPSRTSTFFPYSASHPGGMGYYDRVASPRGSYEYIYHDLEAPHPAPGTPLKEKTVRYTARYPSAWGSPVWVTTFTPRPIRRAGNGVGAGAPMPASGTPFAPGSE
jgi:hypothetical protein